MELSTWNLLGIVAIVGLVIFYKKGAAWGGLTLGAIVGCSIALYYMIKGDVAFNTLYVKHAAIVGALAGIVISLVQRLRNKSKHEKQTSINVQKLD